MYDKQKELYETFFLFFLANNKLIRGNPNVEQRDIKFQWRHPVDISALMFMKLDHKCAHHFK